MNPNRPTPNWRGGGAWGRLGLILLALALGMPASAQMREVYQGRLGQAAVVLELSEAAPGAPVTGRYFYQRHGIDIPLQGTAQALAEALPPQNRPPDADLPLFADPATGQPRIVWQGQRSGGRYRGQWRNQQSGTVLPFDVRRVGRYNPDALAPHGLAAALASLGPQTGPVRAGEVLISLRDTPYDYLRMNVPLQAAGPEVRQGPLAYQLLRDPRTRMAYPRLTRHPDPQALQRANSALQQRHWRLGLLALACASRAYAENSPWAGTLGDFDAEVVQVEYLSSRLMSVVESGSTYCGGAHPHNHYAPFTLDLQHGGHLRFSKLFKGVVEGPHGTTYSAAFMAFVKQQTPPSPDPDGCLSAWPDHLQLHFKQPGLLSLDAVGVSHANAVCNGPHIGVPFDRLRPILQPGADGYLQP